MGGGTRATVSGLTPERRTVRSRMREFLQRGQGLPKGRQLHKVVAGVSIERDTSRILTKFTMTENDER